MKSIYSDVSGVDLVMEKLLVAPQDRAQIASRFRSHSYSPLGHALTCNCPQPWGRGQDMIALLPDAPSSVLSTFPILISSQLSPLSTTELGTCRPFLRPHSIVNMLWQGATRASHDLYIFKNPCIHNNPQREQAQIALESCLSAGRDFTLPDDERLTTNIRFASDWQVSIKMLPRLYSRLGFYNSL